LAGGIGKLPGKEYSQVKEGFYRLQNTWVALFTHYIACGTWEAVYKIYG
jgi:hypothetical protein